MAENHDLDNYSMSLNVSHIKNPLTVISIFAGLSEISGTCVLPFINESNQYLFIWFLMLFPIFLIGLFFYTLNANHRVLYAPSDYKDEGNFLIEKASFYDKKNKLAREVNELSSEPDNKNAEAELEGGDVKEDIPEDPKINDTDDLTDNKIKETIKSDLNDILASSSQDDNTAAKLAKAAEAVRKMQKNTELLKNEKKINYIMNEKSIYLSEKLALDRLSKKLDLKIEKDVKITTNDHKSLFFDGVAIKGKEMHLFEVKFNPTENVAKKAINQINFLSNSIKSNFKSFKIINHVVFVIDEKGEKLNKEFMGKMIYSSDDVLSIHQFDFDDLVFGII